MINLAGHPDPDPICTAELLAAGIDVFRLPTSLSGEVRSSILGTLYGWSFKRAWYYWVAEGPGLPPNYATELWERHHATVRVDGHGLSPHPLRWFHGFGVGHYHVDDEAGLRALAETIKRVVAEAATVPEAPGG